MFSISRTKTSLTYRLFNLFVAFSFFSSMCVLPSNANAQGILNLPAPGTMITPSVSFTPTMVSGITIYPDNPLKFDFIIDSGDANLQGEDLRKETKKLINYFLATLTVPEEEMWVNLSPYEENRIVADGLGVTEMGRDMLAQDYMLKQLTASLMYPEEEIGEAFWEKIYEKTQARFGTTDIPTNTFNKVWIVPEKAVVYVNGTNVFVSESHLKVLLEEDYLAMESNIGNTKHGLGEMTKSDVEQVSEEAKEIIREVIIPEIEKEVNEGKNFANLRQIYNSMILATWYKKNLRKSVLGKVYMDKNKVNGIDLEDKQIKEKIYNQYVEAFKKGVYDYIKEDYDPISQEVIPRKYFSGGLVGTTDETVVEGGESARDPVARQFADEGPEYRAAVNLRDEKGNVIVFEPTTEQPGEGDGAMNASEVVAAIQEFFDSEINRNDRSVGRLTEVLRGKVVDFKISLTGDELQKNDERSGQGYSSEVTEGDRIVTYAYRINPDQDGFDIKALSERIKQDLRPTVNYLYREPDFEAHLGGRWERVIARVTSSEGDGAMNASEVVQSIRTLTFGIANRMTELSGAPSDLREILEQQLGEDQSRVDELKAELRQSMPDQADKILELVDTIW